MKRIVAVLCAFLPLHAATLTVCASGCSYATLQAAYNAAVSDCAIDTIALAHGQTFTASGLTQFNYRPCDGALTIQSDAVSQLPPPGTRATVANAALMPTLTSSDATNPVLSFGSLEMLISAADTTGHTITLTSEANTISQLAVGVPISCTDRSNGLGPAGSGMPQPLQRATQYFITSTSGVTSTQATVQLSTEPGGSPLAISTTDGINSPSTNYYAQPQCSLWNNAHDILFDGINVQVPDPGAGNNYGLAVQVGVSENAVGALVRNITFRHSLIHLDPSFTDRGLQTGIGMDGNGISFEDGYIEAIGFSGVESHGAASHVCQHCTFLNNEVDSIGAAFFTGGSAGIVPQLNVSDLRIQKNYLLTPGWMYIWDSSHAGFVPSVGSKCYYEGGSGAQFIDRTTSPTDCAGGKCMTCQSSGVWAVDTGATFHSNVPLPKTRMEFKEGHDIDISANIIRGNVVGGDTGNTGCIVLPLVEQSLIDANGIFYYDHENVNIHDNWCDRVWSGILVGQTAPIAGPGPTAISGITAGSNLFTFAVGSNAGFTNYTYAFLTGITASGTMGMLNGRWNYECGTVGSCPNSFPNSTTIITDPTSTPDRFSTVSGTYGSGGQIQAVRWRPSFATNVWNNVLTRTGQYPQLSIYPAFNTALARPFRLFSAGDGGPVVRKNTIRQDDTSQGNNFGLTFESSLGHGTYQQAVLKDSIFAGYYYAYQGLGTTDCTSASYGGYFTPTGAANFTHNLNVGPNAGWPNPGAACSDQSNLKTAANDAAVGFVGSDQSVLSNSALSSGSVYSAANRSPVMLSSDGADLGADVRAVQMATSGVMAGVPSWDRLAGLRWNLGSTKVIANLQGSEPWTVHLYSSAAPLAANQVASVADSCTACIVDGVRRQIVITGLSANTEYYFSATDGTKTLVGTITTLAAGSGTYPFAASGSGIRYSPSPSMTSPTSAAAGVVPLATDTIAYIDHGSGTSVTALVAR